MNKLFLRLLLCVLIIGMSAFSGCSNLPFSKINDISQQYNNTIPPTQNSSVQQIINQPKTTESNPDSVVVKVTNKAGEKKDNIKYNKPYYIKVNLKSQIVTIFKYYQENNSYNYLKDMICSTGKASGCTPIGVFTIYQRYNWLQLIGNTYGQYCVRFNGHILFHSIPYSAKNPFTLIWEEYNKIGTPASLGCVRLRVIDAKWIYDNCVNGTIVEIYNGSANESLLQSLKPTQLAAGTMTDPSDSITNSIIGDITKNVFTSISDLQTHTPTSTEPPSATPIILESPIPTFAQTQKPACTLTQQPTFLPTQ